VVPEFGFPAEASEFDHGEGEVEVVFFGFEDDLFVEFEAGHVLGGVGGDEPAVVADGDEDADFHVGWVVWSCGR